MHFISLTGLNFPTAFGLAAALFLSKIPTWVFFDGFKSKKKAGKVNLFPVRLVKWPFPDIFF